MLTYLNMQRCSNFHLCSAVNSFKMKNIFNYSLPKLKKLNSKNTMQISVCHWTFSIRRFSRNCAEDRHLKALHHHKKIFAICIFSSTLLLAWFLQRRKLIRLKKNLEDCVKVPLDKGLYGSNTSMYRYHNFIFPQHIIMSGVLQILPSFKFRSDDIVVASFPKSGTTWVQEIVYMLTHNLQITDKDSEILETRFPYLEYPYPGIKAVSSLSGMRLIKTHLPFSLISETFKSSGAKLIYIIRNPRDVAVSYWHFMRLLTTINFTGSFEEFANMFLSDKVPYGPYFEHIKSYIEERSSNSVLILTYEDLKSNPFRAIKEIADFLMIPITDSEIFTVAAATSFRAMLDNPSVNYEHWKEIGFAHKNRGNFLRKGEVGDWKNYITSEMLLQFQEWENKNKDTVDFSFKYQ